jgi:hypothetical protein
MMKNNELIDKLKAELKIALGYYKYGVPQDDGSSETQGFKVLHHREHVKRVEKLLKEN